ncbi:MAG: hypothetical protein LBV27_06940 [Oscillospiraceae bacterium]|jgi:glycosidase|nr:hypothetical protein [Oscillospiraceae bacterium]
MWFEESVFYHIYPLGFCDAMSENNPGTPEKPEKIEKIADWAPYIKSMGADALYLGPVFDSDKHGYDTRDYTRIDRRLGTNKGFAGVCEKLHQEGIKIVPDGVFNHVGRGFIPFQDVIHQKRQSQYKDWFKIDFNGDSNYGDGFWYEGWEGHFELVKLNLQNRCVVDYLLSCVKGWIEDYDIDGLRLDVAYSLDKNFIKALRRFAKALKPDFFLLGECLHGDYNQFVSPELLDSCTNYECYKGLYSSFNDMNMFEIAYSLNRQFGAESWTLYKDKHLMIFADNHDVSRIAGILKEKKHLPLAYGLMFAMPGIPCIYYGSEWGETAIKSQGDDALRPSFAKPVENSLSVLITKLCGIYKENRAFSQGSYRQLAVSNHLFAFERTCSGNKIIFALNIAATPGEVEVGSAFSGVELLTGKSGAINGKLVLAPCSMAIWRADT